MKKAEGKEKKKREEETETDMVNERAETGSGEKKMKTDERVERASVEVRQGRRTHARLHSRTHARLHPRTHARTQLPRHLPTRRSASVLACGRYPLPQSPATNDPPSPAAPAPVMGRIAVASSRKPCIEIGGACDACAHAQDARTHAWIGVAWRGVAAVSGEEW
jgi:hypothetical protein